MGLIGTSLGMALRNANDKESPLGPITVTGYDQNSRNSTEARGRLAIDRIAKTLDEAIADAQIVVVAVPVQAVREIFQAIGMKLKSGVVVTDVASTKSQVMAWAREFLPNTVDFIGGHPMAGRERSGPEAADATLFQDTIYCVTSTPQTRPHAFDAINALIQQIGAKPYYVEPFEHDTYVAGVSHLPFVLSTLLVEATSRSAGWKEMSPLAATGFRDISRLASGDPVMHRDICLTNRDAIIRWIDETFTILHELRATLDTNNAETLLAWFEHARTTRETWLAARPNLRPGEEDFQAMNRLLDERPSMFGRMFGGRRERK
jgi:prephenate dehydrogenase